METESAEQLYQRIIIDGEADVVVSTSRVPGLTPEGEYIPDALAGNILPRLCQYAGGMLCAVECQAPPNFDNSQKQCASQNGREVFAALGINLEDVRLGKVRGSANVAFIDQTQPDRGSEGYAEYSAVDAVVGYGDTVKACRLADCGLLVVTGTDYYGMPFDGFVHATRLNMNGTEQFTNHKDGTPTGGVTRMLSDIRAHYASSDMRVELVAGITPSNYLFDFTPTTKDLDRDSGITAEQKREDLFMGWHEQGWITPHQDKDGAWDGKTYQVDMIAAIRAQVTSAGLANFYTENVVLDGDPVTGHASNRAGKRGQVNQARDLYVVVPYGYQV